MLHPRPSQIKCGWITSAFKLLVSADDIWHVPSELRAFDQSLSRAIETLMRNTADASFLRRLASLERETLMAGKSVPFRKLVSMIAHR